MRKRASVALLLAFAAGVHLCRAQAQSRTPPPAVHQLPPGILDLPGGWRVHAGDNPAWAQPDFDDSAWPIENLVDLPIRSGFVWYRQKVDLPARGTPLALFLMAPGGSYEAYVNGQSLPAARIGSPLYSTSVRENSLPLPVAGGPMEIALRVYFRAPDTEVYGTTLQRVAIGSPSAIALASQLAHDDRLLGILPSIAINLLLMLAGLAALLLFLPRREDREYLWLGLYLAVSGVSEILGYSSIAGAVPNLWNAVFGDPLGYPAIVLQIEFTYAFARRRVDPWMRLLEVVTLGWILFSVLTNLHLLAPRTYLLLEAAINLPPTLLLPLLLFLWLRHGNREAGWLILPSMLASSATVVTDTSLVAPFLHWGTLASLTQPFVIDSVPINFGDAASLVFLLAIGLVMARRFTRVSQEQARASAELDAAREIQQRLVPAVLPQPANCRIQAAYLPAQEVGGDFYQVIEQPDGATLIVVGDVSGKGLRAAMTGARAIGALQATAATNTSPAALLEALNRIIHSLADGGFITCLCASLSPDGNLTLANAGHLAPYRNGIELPLENGLPLGITPDATFGETTIHLAPGDLFTFLSDGVVEATDAATRELFGFERTEALSTQPAEAIAAAARRFGQEDDITVLTLTFVPASELAVAPEWLPEEMKASPVRN